MSEPTAKIAKVRNYRGHVIIFVDIMLFIMFVNIMYVDSDQRVMNILSSSQMIP